MNSVWAVPLLFVLARLAAEGSLEDSVALEKKMAELINVERSARGLDPFQYLPRLADVARAHSRAMAEAATPSHEAGGTSLEGRIKSVYPDACFSGENISKHINIDYALADLLTSPGHRENLLSPRYAGIGVGIVRAKGFLFITQDFIQICNKR